MQWPVCILLLFFCLVQFFSGFYHVDSEHASSSGQLLTHAANLLLFKNILGFFF